jgi:heme/copper-type cytochrome/quinol oxidase subunit 1
MSGVNPLSQFLRDFHFDHRRAFCGKVFNWISTLYKGISGLPQRCFAIGFVPMFISGGLTEFSWGILPRYSTSYTYFVVAIFTS